MILKLFADSHRFSACCSSCIEAATVSIQACIFFLISHFPFVIFAGLLPLDLSLFVICRRLFPPNMFVATLRRWGCYRQVLIICIKPTVSYQPFQCSLGPNICRFWLIFKQKRRCLSNSIWQELIKCGFLPLIWSPNRCWLFLIAPRQKNIEFSALLQLHFVILV